MNGITLDKQNIKPNSICFAFSFILCLMQFCSYSIKLGICLNTFKEPLKPIVRFPLSPCESVWFYLMIKADVGRVCIQVVSRTLMNIPEGVTGGTACPR